MAVFLAAPVTLSISATAAFTDVDVSANVPSGATGVLLLVVNTEAANNRIGLRKNGSTDNRTQFGGFSNHCAAAVGVDANRLFEVFVDDNLTQTLYLIGYTTDDAVFFTNGINKSTGTTAAWVDVDVSGDTGVDTAIGVYVEIQDTTGSGNGWGLRKNGSTDNRVAINNDPRHQWAAIGVDGSEIFEQQIEATSVDLWLLGYQISGASFNTNALDRILATTGGYASLTALPANSIGALYEIWKPGANNRTVALRAAGDTNDPNFTVRVDSHIFRYSACDGNQTVEGKISATDADFFEIGNYTVIPGIVDSGSLMLLGAGS